ncbi:MAG: cell division protein ZipA C-terminal FtsZ-binding domain-containing protein [Steroidobacteraceae bacterium]
MSELRWTLLILGVVFIAALSWWERRRPRQAFAPRLREAGLSHTEFPYAEAYRTASPEPAVAGEPWIGESGLAAAALSDEPIHEDADAHEAGPGPLEELPTLIIADDDPRLALKALWDAQPPEPTLIDPEAGAVVETLAASEAMAPIGTPGPIEACPIEASAPSAVTGAGPAQGATPEIPGAEGVGAVRIVESAFGGAGAEPVEPIVEWPPEGSRRILALRIVAPQQERFGGRTLRLALAAEGFLLGRFAIFHKPDEANRAVLSAAALTRPGAFDLENMDSQRYGGLSLFAVLPGPKPPPQAFEDLLCAARNLNERLEGALQDERGGPLTPLRVASIRDSLRTEGTRSAPAAHGA